MTRHDHEAGRPPFLVTIDTEGDDLWSRPRTITTANAAHLPRFQALCERYGFKPTYLTTYEMATSPVFQPFARDVLRRGAGEVGMHLHAWNSPPLVPLTPDDLRFQPYLVEYAEPVMREKVARLTGLIEDVFGVEVVSHRAGRWALDATYARLLVAYGYLVDCSVTPHVSWREHKGDPSGTGGSDYRAFRATPYFVDLDDIARPGASPLLEVPVTIVRRRQELASRLPGAWTDRPSVRRVLDRLCRRVWLRPRGGNLAELLWVVEEAARRGAEHLEFMLHSSELMPGGSPTFRTPSSIEALYHDLEVLFGSISGRYRGATLAEYGREASRRARPARSPERPAAGDGLVPPGRSAARGTR